ncbi:MAG: bifunctional folylpolyglutamate synthase/dihydrofolate synthase, partial [Tumebacillaceae bacterium]
MSQAEVSQAENWIHSFDRFDGRTGIKPGLERMEAMLERLGNPHQRLKFLHVAGTNGKGSTCAYLARILEAAGYRVGLYTSPYLEQFNDRMSVSGENISDTELTELVAQLRPVVEEVSTTSCGRPTEFEVVTTLSLLHYAKQQVDFVVLETGLGGRLDSTNVVTPLLSLITNVGRDHEAILGSTIEQIAAEKAGIIKPGVPILTTATGVARDVIVRRAEELGATSYEGNRDFTASRTSYSLDGQTFDWTGWGVTLL